jgi:type II secretory pathway component PulK
LLSATCLPGGITRAGRGVSRGSPSLWKERKEVAIAVTIGASVALIVIGAILRFGVTWQPAHVDLQVIGVILMVAGALGLVLSLLFMVLRRNDRRSAQVYEERRYNEPPM